MLRSSRRVINQYDLTLTGRMLLACANWIQEYCTWLRFVYKIYVVEILSDYFQY